LVIEKIGKLFFVLLSVKKKGLRQLTIPDCGFYCILQNGPTFVEMGFGYSVA